MTSIVQGASRGIGLQFCKHLVNRGSTVIACCRNPQQAHELQALQRSHPSHVDIVEVDVSNEMAIARAAEYVKGTHGGAVDLLINSAGMLSPAGRGETSLKDVSAEALSATFSVNSVGPVLMAKYFKTMLEAGQGSFGKQGTDAKSKHTSILVNMSARVGSIGDNNLGGWYSYRMSKSALNMANKSLSVELGRGRKKVICLALHPGTVNTDLSRPYHKNVPADKLFSVEQSIGYLMNIIDNATISDSGKYMAFDGTIVPF